MKKKVAIITCIGKSNFGNRLQNYALQKVLEDYLTNTNKNYQNKVQR